MRVTAAPGKLTRVVLTNFKSIGHCEVALGPLTFLVGPNGSGKSNFIDALRFCRDALRTPLDQVLAKRNTNLHALLHRSPANPKSLEMRFEFELPLGESGYYEFAIAPAQPRGFVVLSEKCALRTPIADTQTLFEVEAGLFTHRIDPMNQPVHRPSAYRLHLANAPDVRVQLVYELLSSMEFYTPDPALMRIDLDTTGSADILDEDGENIASVLDRLSKSQQDTKVRINEYLRAILPGLQRVEAEEFRSSYKLLNFYLDIPGSTQPFLASSMSDGTLRALALLVALFQNAGRDSGLSLIGIEEPEAGLHPAATAVLLDALQEASASAQIVVTSHSSDLLDNKNIPSDSIRAVDWDAGETRIEPIDAATRSVLHDRLYTAGELLRMGGLHAASGRRREGAGSEVPLPR
jgi:predicted ATPase